MPPQLIYVVCADGEEDRAELIAPKLREAGYAVAHFGTTMVGDSLVGEAARAVASGSPIVVCATAKAAGSSWAHKIVNSARGGPFGRVYVVKIERDAYVDQFALDTKVARYCDDPAQALEDLLRALSESFPPPSQVEVLGQITPATQFLDEPTKAGEFDFDALKNFRSNLRSEKRIQYPPSLTPSEFLRQAGLLISGGLTRTGVLLFGANPTLLFPNSATKCSRYYGRDRASVKEVLTFEGATEKQIIAARQFIEDRVRLGEVPSPDQAQSVDIFGYPMIAVREILANALVHRDYAAADACVHVRLFDDRLEISSPGSWVGKEITAGRGYPLSTLAGESKKRNMRLANVLSWIRLVEGEGSGIPSAVRDCEENGSSIPIVVEEDGFICVTLRPTDYRDLGAYVVRRSAISKIPELDIAFLAELGGSQSVVDNRMNRIRDLVDELRARAGPTKVRASILGYRDHEGRHRIDAREDQDKLVVGCTLGSIDAVRRELDRLELWQAVPIINMHAAPIEDALQLLAKRCSWRPGIRHVVFVVGSRPPHPQMVDPRGGLTPPCPHGYEWESELAALREKQSVHCIAITGIRSATAGSYEDHSWSQLGAQGRFTSDSSNARLIEAVITSTTIDDQSVISRSVDPTAKMA